MIISSKGRYALRVMVYLAVHHSDEYIPLKEISDKEELSNLIEAASGHGGGYRLTRKPEDYSVGEILKLTEGTLAPVTCLNEETLMCEHSSSCYTLPIWQGLADVINNYLDNMTLADVAATAIDKAGNKTAYNA